MYRKRTAVLIAIGVAALMIMVPGASRPATNLSSPSHAVPLVSYNPAPANRFHAPLSSIATIALAKATPSVHSLAAIASPNVAVGGGGMTSVPINALRFINDNSYMPQSETTVAVDPQNTSRIVGGVNDARMFFCPSLPPANCPSGYTESLSGFSTTGNGGVSLMKSNDIPSLVATLYNGTAPFTSVLTSWGDPMVAYAGNGNFYYASLAISQNTSANGIELAISNGNLWKTGPACATPLLNPTTNGCWTGALVFGNTSNVAGSFEDKDTMAVDMDSSSTYFGDAYIAWDHFFPNGTSSTYLARCTPSLTCTMLSGGSASVISGASPFVAFSTVVVGANGNVYVSWCNFGTFTTTGPVTCYETTSGPGGTSFGAIHQIVSFMGAGTLYPGFSALSGYATEQFRTASIDTLAVDTSGNSNNLYFAIDVCTGGNYYAFYSPALPGDCGQSGIIFARSTNGGATWAKTANIATGGSVNVQPSVSVDPSNGDVVVTYYTTAFDPFNHRTDVVSQVSTDQGKTWTMVRVTSTSDEPSADPAMYNYLAASGFGGSFIVPQYGDYLTCEALDGTIYVTFTGNYQVELGTFQADPFLGMAEE